MKPYWQLWRASSGAPGGWRVTRYPNAAVDGEPPPGPLEELKGKTGRVIYFRSQTGATRRAMALNVGRRRL